MIQFAKRTGDYSVLSHADLCVLALTYMLDCRYKAEKIAKSNAEVRTCSMPCSYGFTCSIDHTKQASTSTEAAQPSESSAPTGKPEELSQSFEAASLQDNLDNSVSQEPARGGHEAPVAESSVPNVTEEENSLAEPEDDAGSHEVVEHQQENPSSPHSSSPPLYDDPSDEDDGEGEWITPSNVGTHKSKAMGMLPSVNDKSRGKVETVGVGCMSADFAMQNVLLQMNLCLVGTEGKKIVRLKTWVLRCHACFK